jgi:hypothetical protein
MPEDADWTLEVTEFIRVICGTKMAEEICVLIGRGQRGLGRDWMLNATSVPGSIANGEYNCKILLLK